MSDSASIQTIDDLSKTERDALNVAITNGYGWDSLDGFGAAYERLAELGLVHRDTEDDGTIIYYVKPAGRALWQSWQARARRSKKPPPSEPPPFGPVRRRGG